MKQIIELAQEQLSKEESVLNELQAQKESALNEALRLQSEIPIQTDKVKTLSKNLSELYSHYGYPNGQSGCASVSAEIPAVAKSEKPSMKKSSSVNKDDIFRQINSLSYSDYAAAYKAIKALNDED